MSNSNSRILFRLAILCILVVSARLVLARHNLSGEPRKSFTVVRDLLDAAYADMFGKDRYVRLCTGRPVDSPNSWDEMHGIEFEINRFAPGASWNQTYSQGKLVPEPENTTYLKGSFWLDGKGGVLRILVEGDVARTKQNEEIHRLVESHPEWSEEQAVLALKRAGARYGPAQKKQFIQSIDLEKFQKVLGRLSVKSVEFSTLSPNHVGNFAELTWFVVLDARSADGTHQDYSLHFEPFEGRLTAVFARGVV